MVELVDYSAEMLAEAKRNAEEGGVAGRISFRQGDLSAIPAFFPEPAFDLVVCHNVLQYVDDLEAALKALSRGLKPGGLISILCVNRYSESFRHALMFQDLDAAQASLDARSMLTITFGVPAALYAAEDMRAPLQAAGCSVVGEYGVRCVCDYIANNEIKNEPEFFAKLERLEHALTDKHPYYLLARFFQIIARKA
jgi:S-adenosylmethionine-dependent methyltransferase